MEFVWHTIAKKKNFEGERYKEGWKEKKQMKEKKEGKKNREKGREKKKWLAPCGPPQATSINTPAGCITNIDAISCYGQKHTLRRLACFQWLQVGVEGNQVEGRKDEGIKGEKES